MTLEQRLFLHRQLAQLLEPLPPDVRLKLLEDFEAEIKGRQPPGTTAVTPEARQLLREAADFTNPSIPIYTTNPQP